LIIKTKLQHVGASQVLWWAYGRLWAWHPAEANLPIRTSRIDVPSPNFLAFKVSQISAFIRTDRRTWLVRTL